MSREIKFRAWSHGVKSSNPAVKRRFGEWVSPPQMLYDEKPGDCLVWKSQGQNIEVMQFTGLKDRNGKEIYEGDVVKYTSKERTGTKVSYKRRGYDTYSITSDVEITGYVKLDLFETSIIGKLVTFVVDTNQTTKYESYFWGEGKRTDRPKITTNSLVKPLNANREYEIIGNIYETPELLEVQA